MCIQRVHPVVTCPTLTSTPHFPSQEWSEPLALLAREWAASCSLDTAEQEQSLGHVGWNTHQSAHREASFTEVIDSWFLEGRDYVYLGGQCRENSTCQHYTQVRKALDEILCV